MSAQGEEDTALLAPDAAACPMGSDMPVVPPIQIPRSASETEPMDESPSGTEEGKLSSAAPSPRDGPAVLVPSSDGSWEPLYLSVDVSPKNPFHAFVQRRGLISESDDFYTLWQEFLESGLAFPPPSLDFSTLHAEPYFAQADLLGVALGAQGGNLPHPHASPLALLTTPQGMPSFPWPPPMDSPGTPHHTPPIFGSYMAAPPREPRTSDPDLAAGGPRAPPWLASPLPPVMVAPLPSDMAAMLAMMSPPQGGGSGGGAPAGRYSQIYSAGGGYEGPLDAYGAMAPAARPQRSRKGSVRGPSSVSRSQTQADPCFYWSSEQGCTREVCRFAHIPALKGKGQIVYQEADLGCMGREEEEGGFDSPPAECVGAAAVTGAQRGLRCRFWLPGSKVAGCKKGSSCDFLHV